MLEKSIIKIILLITLAYSVDLIQIPKEYTTEKQILWFNVYFSHTSKNFFEWLISSYMLSSISNDAVTDAGLKEHFSIFFKTKVTQPLYQHNYCSSFPYLQPKFAVIISLLATVPINSEVGFSEEKPT